MEERALKLLVMRDIKGYGNKRIADLVSSYGSVDKAFDVLFKKGAIIKTKSEEYKKELEECQKSGIKIITYLDDEYPTNLKLINSPPLLLFAKGNLDLLKMPAVSIVGTRKAFNDALEWAYNNAKELARMGYTIISGGAFGIDIAAHKGALDISLHTICVLGSGINNIYPKENKPIIDEIAKRGLVLSEMSPNQHVNHISLLERNRITSGLGNKVLIVAANSSGGTMSQYKVALNQKKDIYCPHPDLGIEPSGGIKQILKTNNKVKAIRNIKEMFGCIEENCESQKMLESFV